MALKTTQSVAGEHMVYSVLDEAIDLDASVAGDLPDNPTDEQRQQASESLIRRYRDTHDNSLLALRGTPTRFVVRALDPDERDMCRVRSAGYGEGAGQMYALLVFLVGCVEVRGLEVVSADGKTRRVDEPLPPQDPRVKSLPVNVRCDVATHVIALTHPPHNPAPEADVGKPSPPACSTDSECSADPTA